MSLNLTLQARKSKSNRWILKDLYQTPTDVTFKLLKKRNVFKAYAEWLPTRVTEYATTEEERNQCLGHAHKHLQEVEQWIKEMKARGYRVVFSYI